MNALAQDIRKLIADRIPHIPATQLLAIATSICANDEGAVIFQPPPARWGTVMAQRFTRHDLHGNVVQSGGVAIHDSETDLTWSAAPLECGAVNWKDAMKAALNHRLFGKDNWRAPTVKERVSIVDYSKVGPALYSEFTAGSASWEWTSTLDAEDPSGCAWVVGLRDGNVGRDDQAYRSGVRAVRAGQPLSLFV